MTPAQLAEILQGLRLHGEGSGARVLHARPDKAGNRLILGIEDGGVRREWVVTIATLTERYRPQLQAYVAAVRRIWPGRPLRAGLLLTENRQWLELLRSDD